MKPFDRHSRKKHKPPIHQNPAHIIKGLVSLREQYPQNNQFTAHITKGSWMEGWLGLVFWFINDKKERKDGEWRFFLGSHFAEKLCPRKGKNDPSILTLLQEKGIISILKKGKRGRYPTQYVLKKEWADCLPRNYKLNDRQKKRLEKAHRWASNQQYHRHPCLRWVDTSIARITLPESDELRTALETPNKVKAANRVMDFLRGDIPPEKQKNTNAGYCGTFYTPLWSLPRELVQTLLIDGEEIAQLDITAAHPSTLPSIIRIWGKGIPGIDAEAAKLSRELESGRIYEQLAKKTGLSPEKAKNNFLSALNGRHNHTCNDSTFREFANMFPLAAKVIMKIRRNDPKELNIEMANTLAKAIEKAIVTFWEYEIPVYPRSDEIVCRKSDATFVREVLAAYFLDETGVNAKVGKERVSFIPTEEEVWKKFCERYDLAKFTKCQQQRIEDDLPLWNCVKMIRVSKPAKNSSIAA